MSLDPGRLRAIAHPITDTLPPGQTGAFVVFSDTGFKNLDWDHAAGPVYVGVSDTDMAQAIQNEHFTNTSESPLRRLYGAILKDELALACRSSGFPHGFDCERFSLNQPGDAALTAWLQAHLRVSLVLSHPVDQLQDLIDTYHPLLNLSGWNNPWLDRLQSLLQACELEARLGYHDPLRYNPFNPRRLARHQTGPADYTKHGQRVKHIATGWTGRIAFQYPDTGEYAILWEPHPPSPTNRHPLPAQAYEPEEIVFTGEPAEAWLETPDEPS